MRALVDAQAVIWHLNGDARLPVTVRAWLESPEHSRVFGAGSAWEIIIKGSGGKLRLDRPPVEYVENFLAMFSMERLPISFAHVYRVASLPRLHGDPFDRMLAAQALEEGLPVITGVAAIAQYGVETIWDD